jgi:ElaB/YqjD/DUF883 family membrane-anchored ribosome-binding protein
MTETIDAIQEQLRPANIVSNATESVRNATVGKVKQMARSARNSFRGDSGVGYDDNYGVMDRVRENPIPAAIAVASIAWIAFSGRRTGRRTSPAIYGSTRDGEPFVRETRIAAYDEEDSSAAYGYEGEGVARRAQSALRDSGERVRRATSTAQNGVQRLMRENPLAAGAIAAAVGLTVGLALPETRRENELMGETRDAVVDRAKGAARQAAERVQDAAQQVQDVAGEAVKKVTAE